jgi:phosphatidylglycerophosphatase A
MGSAAVAVFLVFLPDPNWVVWIFLVSTLLGFILAKPAIKILGHNDPACIVIDEAAGMAVSLLFIPLSTQNIVIAFLLFRFFDIKKPLGIRSLDRWRNPMSVVMDDLLAGLYTNLILQVLVRI